MDAEGIQVGDVSVVGSIRGTLGRGQRGWVKVEVRQRNPTSQIIMGMQMSLRADDSSASRLSPERSAPMQAMAVRSTVGHAAMFQVGL